MNGLSQLEEQVMLILLSDEDERIATLRQQFKVCKIKKREFTGVGFFLHFDVPEDSRRILGEPELVITKGVVAEIDGLNYGASFALWIKNGALDQLEGSTFAEAWPVEIQKFKIKSTLPLSVKERARK